MVCFSWGLVCVYCLRFLVVRYRCLSFFVEHEDRRVCENRKVEKGKKGVGATRK